MSLCTLMSPIISYVTFPLHIIGCKADESGYDQMSETRRDELKNQLDASRRDTISKKFPDAFIFRFILKTSECLFKHGKKPLKHQGNHNFVNPLSIMWPMPRDDPMETATAHVIHVSVEDNRQLPQILHQILNQILNQQIALFLF